MLTLKKKNSSPVLFNTCKWDPSVVWFGKVINSFDYYLGLNMVKMGRKMLGETRPFDS
jgi:hypothetical protein